MDFYQIKEREGQRKATLEVFPDFKVVRSKDLMVRGKQFYAVWDEEQGLWSTDEYDVQRLVDADIRKHEIRTIGVFQETNRKYLNNFSSNSWLQFRNYVGHLSDSYTQLDARLTFANTEVKKGDYVSRRLPYALTPGDISAWEALVNVLYEPEERAKIEWAIGAIVAGDSKSIQKFLVFYGAPGTGKSTIFNIIEWMFEGYVEWFVAKELTGANNSFALEAFKKNPLVAIEHDGDLSKIIDNSKLNSLVAHETMQINEKNKPIYSMAFNAMLMIGSNKPVMITDAKAGIIRRLIDIHPTGILLPPRKYQSLMNQIKFELGAIADHCHKVYLSMGKDYYSGYQPTQMMLQTDVFFNFIEAHFDIFKAQNGVTLNQAYELYKAFIEDSGIERRLPRYKLREELKNYFETFEDRAEVDGARVRSWFGGFIADRFKAPTGKTEDQHMFALVMEESVSLFDKEMRNRPAQYSKEDGHPEKFWTNSPRERNGKTFIPDPEWVVNTKLKDLDTSKEHYVKVPLNHIVIDFDLKDADGNKSAERNLEAASQWPSTYAEFSKSGAGIHLHYIWDGDPTELSRVYDDGIEVKVFTGESSLRRMLSACNNVPVATISSGLPLKEKKVINTEAVKSELKLRELIDRNLRKEIHPGTKPSMDFIFKILEDAYKSDLEYDVTDMRQRMLNFASKSSNHNLYCIGLLKNMKFKSEGEIQASKKLAKDERLVFFDTEVFPNLFVICWKFENDKKPLTGKPIVTRMINPSAQAVEELLSLKLVGYNCRRYDNHILYGALMGYSPEQLYKLSQKLISNSQSGYFGEAWNISYTDIYDFASAANKKGLKKWQIELGIHHQELGLPWDEPVPDNMIDKVAEYCDNDVISEEVVFNHLHGDWVARQILAGLSGLTVNDTTNKHSTRIMFGDEVAPQSEFVYTDLSEMFPGYKYELGKSTYKGEITGEGGYVYAEPGMYDDVALLDVASMHPTSIEQLDLFGGYTKRFSEIKNTRMMIKRGDIESARQMMGGKLKPYLEDEENLGGLSDALKTVINSVYGLTSAKFDNSFKDPKNIDNIVAKRGALFMVDLKHFVQSKGFTVAHIKTDSIKIPNATKQIIEDVMEFGQQYGYEFEHEATYEKMCLVNDAVYIAKTAPGKKPAKWTATGAQFAHPVVFKTLFSHEPLEFKDFLETKMVNSALYLDFSEDDAPMALEEQPPIRTFVGKAGAFVPVMEGHGGGRLIRVQDGKDYNVTGTTGYRWLEAEVIQNLPDGRDIIDMSYYDVLVNKALDKISQYGDFERFIA